MIEYLEFVRESESADGTHNWRSYNPVIYRVNIDPNDNNYLTVTANGVSKSVFVRENDMNTGIEMKDGTLGAYRGARGIFDGIKAVLVGLKGQCDPQWAYDILDYIMNNMSAQPLVRPKTDRKKKKGGDK